MGRIIIILAIIFTLLSFQCSKNDRITNVDISGGWYVENITDKSTGLVIPNMIPADTITIHFQNDTSYFGGTHLNLYSGKYSFNGQSNLILHWPLSYLLPEDQLGTAFMELIRECSIAGGTPGCFGIPSNNSITLQGNTLFIDNKGKYKGVFKKL